MKGSEPGEGLQRELGGNQRREGTGSRRSLLGTPGWEGDLESHRVGEQALRDHKERDPES